MKQELNKLSVEELEYLMGRLNQPALSEFERELQLPKVNSTIHQLEGPNIMGGSGVEMQSPEELDFNSIRELGMEFFMENKDKIKSLICHNESIKKEVLENEKSNTEWLIDNLTQAFMKDVDLKKTALVLAVYLVKIGIKTLCN